MKKTQRTTSSQRVISVFAAKATARRTTSQRIADWLTTKSGTMMFLSANAIFFGVWIVFNIHLIPGVEPFDAYPFGFLTMIVSLEAIMLSIVVLISQNREAHIANTREEVTLQMDLIIEQELTKALQIMTRVAEKQGIDLSDDTELRQMLKPTDVEKIENAIESQV